MSRAAVVKHVANLVVKAVGGSSLSAIESGFNDSKTDHATRISFKVWTQTYQKNVVAVTIVLQENINSDHIILDELLFPGIPLTHPTNYICAVWLFKRSVRNTHFLC